MDESTMSNTIPDNPNHNMTIASSNYTQPNYITSIWTNSSTPIPLPDPDHVRKQFFADQAFSVHAQITLTCLYVITIALSLTGNTIVILVLSLSKRSSQNLARLLINLAVCDIVMAIFCMPFTFVNVMLGRWLFGSFMCKLVGFMQVVSVSASIYTNVVIGLDRWEHDVSWLQYFRGMLVFLHNEYLAVSNPLRQKVSKLNPLILIGIIWAFSIAIASPELKLLTMTKQERWIQGVHITYNLCRSTGSRAFKQVYCVIIFMVTYLVPLTTLFAVYTLIGKALWAQRFIPGQEDRQRSLVRRRSRIKVTKMLCALVLTFAACWFPYHVFNLVNHFTPFPRLWRFLNEHPQLFYSLYCTCHWLAMANSFTNPAIYNFLSDDFRHDLRGMYKRVSLHSSNGGATTSNPNYNLSDRRHMRSTSQPGDVGSERRHVRSTSHRILIHADMQGCEND